MGLLDWLFGPDEEPRKRLFISFAVEDSEYRDHLVAQARNHRSPFDFIDMSVKRAWDQAEWKRRCRTKIKSCDGAIALLSHHTLRASGALWEMRCALEEGVPIVGMYIRKNDPCKKPSELRGVKTMTWSWPNLQRFIDSL